SPRRPLGGHAPGRPLRVGGRVAVCVGVATNRSSQGRLLPRGAHWGGSSTRRCGLNESLVGPTGRLVEFLRDLATARQPRQSDVRASEQVLWFADLPAQVTLFSEAGAGDLLFSVDPVPAEPPPAVPRGLDVDPDTLDDPTTEPEIDATDPAARAWLERWRCWAEADRRSAGQRRWYAELARTARRLSQQDDEYELVVATG